MAGSGHGVPAPPLSCVLAVRAVLQLSGECGSGGYGAVRTGFVLARHRERTGFSDEPVHLRQMSHERPICGTSAAGEHRSGVDGRSLRCMRTGARGVSRPQGSILRLYSAGSSLWAWDALWCASVPSGPCQAHRVATPAILCSVGGSVTMVRWFGANCSECSRIGRACSGCPDAGTWGRPCGPGIADVGSVSSSDAG